MCSRNYSELNLMGFKAAVHRLVLQGMLDFDEESYPLINVQKTMGNGPCMVDLPGINGTW